MLPADFFPWHFQNLRYYSWLFWHFINTSEEPVFFENWTWTFIFLFLGTVMFMATWVCILYCLLCKMILSCDVLQIYFNEIPDEIIEKLVRIVSCNFFFFFLWMFLKQTVLQCGAIFCCWVASLPLILVLCV